MSKKFLNQTVNVVLIILLNYLAFFVFDLKPACAYFDDEENITDSTMSIGILDLSTNSIADFSPQVTPSQVTTRTIDIKNNGNLLLQANMTIANLGDNFDLCANLDLKIMAGTATVYSGSLIELSSTPILIPAQTIQAFNFTATLSNNDPALQNKTCSFDLITNSWQDDVAIYGSSGFSDQETLANVIKSGSWDATLPPMPPEPPVMPPSSPRPGDVVINEIMWMGSQDINNPNHDGPNDQWVELKNISSGDLHLKGWYLTYKNNAGNELELITIGNNRIVKSGEYFVLSYYNKHNSAINVQPDEAMDKIFDYGAFQLKLYANSTSPILIDTAGNGNEEPTKGDKTNFYSMERNDVPSDGTNYDNWHTCLDTNSTTMYWDSDRTEQGTPGATNLSQNDLSPALDATPTPSSNSSVISNPEINPEINNIQNKDISTTHTKENTVPEETTNIKEPQTEDSSNQITTTENSPSDQPIELPIESQKAIEPTPINIKPTDSQNNNPDPNNNDT